MEFKNLVLSLASIVSSTPAAALFLRRHQPPDAAPANQPKIAMVRITCMQMLSPLLTTRTTHFNFTLTTAGPPTCFNYVLVVMLLQQSILPVLLETFLVASYRFQVARH